MRIRARIPGEPFQAFGAAEIHLGDHSGVVIERHLHRVPQGRQARRGRLRAPCTRRLTSSFRSVVPEAAAAAAIGSRRLYLNVTPRPVPAAIVLRAPGSARQAQTDERRTTSAVYVAPPRQRPIPIVMEGTTSIVGNGYESDMPGFGNVLSDAENRPAGSATTGGLIAPGLLADGVEKRCRPGQHHKAPERLHHVDDPYRAAGLDLGVPQRREVDAGEVDQPVPARVEAAAEVSKSAPA